MVVIPSSENFGLDPRWCPV